MCSFSFLLCLQVQVQLNLVFSRTDIERLQAVDKRFLLLVLLFSGMQQPANGRWNLINTFMMKK